MPCFAEIFREKEKLKQKQDVNTILLASASPRRKEILTRLGLPFEVKPADIDERISVADPRGAAEELALKKVKASRKAAGLSGFRWHLAADTIVTAEGKMLGKPEDEKEAKGFLRMLSGKKHEVITALSFLDTGSGSIITLSDSSIVWFAPLGEKDIDWYIGTGEWEGAAGGYRIQEKGECLVEKIEGSFSNIVGLPIRLFFSILLAAGYPVHNLPSGIPYKE